MNLLEKVDLVLKIILKGHNLVYKLTEKYHRPYKIIKIYRNQVMYDVQHKYQDTILERIHQRHLKEIL